MKILEELLRHLFPYNWGGLEIDEELVKVMPERPLFL